MDRSGLLTSGLSEMEKTHIQYLYERYVRGIATDDELSELKSLLSDQDDGHQVISWLDATWEDLDDELLADVSEERRRALLGRILKKSKRATRHRRIGIWSAAAVIVATVSFFYHHGMFDRQANETVSLTQAGVHIEPGTDKAILTLADGSQVLLDEMGEGKIMSDSFLQISKTSDDVLVYESLRGSTSPHLGAGLKYNTLTTPAGGQYQVMLPDGTKVMLNASSSLRYPQMFPEVGERLVEFEGEGYFEVVSDPQRAFVVKTASAHGHQQIRVLGTEFNVNSYDREAAILTTVVGGRVQVSGDGADHVLLESGQQSVFQSAPETASIVRREHADLNEVLAWKEGLFIFNNEPLPDLLKRVSRWYNVSFTYESDLRDIRFQGNYFRDKGLLNLLENLEAIGSVQFRIDQSYSDERRIYVTRN